MNAVVSEAVQRATKPIVWVGQEHPKGCVVACLAMLAGLTYAEVRAAWPELPANECLSMYEAHRWLNVRGFEATLLTRHHYRFRTEHTVWPPEPFADMHLVSVSPYEGASTGHEVVMLADGRVLDPETPRNRRLCEYGHVNSVTSVTCVERALSLPRETGSTMLWQPTG